LFYIDGVLSDHLVEYHKNYDTNDDIDIKSNENELTTITLFSKKYG